MSSSIQLLNEQQFFSFNGEKLSGVASVSFGYANTLENSPYLGGANFGYFLNGPVEGVVEVSRFLIYNDPLLNFTGDSSFSGEFNYGGRKYFFESGYLNSYSVSAAVGEIPQVNCSISVWAGLKTGAAEVSPQVEEFLFIPSPKSISVSGMDFSDNRVRSFNYSLSISRQPIYSLEGGKKAEFVNFIAPINISSTIEMDASNSDMRESYYFGQKEYDDRVIITVKDRTLAETLSSFEIKNAQLIGETIRADAGSGPVKSISIGGYMP